MSTGVAIKGSTSSHGGEMVTASGVNFQTPEGPVCISGDMHSCPIQGHGITSVTGNSIKAVINGKAVIINGAVAGCGAIINGNFATKCALS